MAWTVQGSDPGVSEGFGNCTDQPWGLPSLLYNGSFLGVKRTMRGMEHTHLAPRLKKEQSYTYTPPLCLYSRL